MANHPSALKRMRQSEDRRLRNMAYRSQVRTAVKKFLKAATEKAAEAPALLRQAASLLQKGAARGVFHKNMASRTISRLSKRLPVA